MTAKVIYTGNLRAELTHLDSGTMILNDAPKDNQGNGASFSPTDMVATALGSCMAITMGIYARNHGLDVEGTTVEITKVMASNPRRIARIEAILTMPKDLDFSEKDRATLERVAHTCPVGQSLHPDLEQVIKFNW